jgi:Protein of unknown function (DUF3667)
MQSDSHEPEAPSLPERQCLNCGEPLTLHYCPRCGQEAVPSAVPVKEFLHELAGHLFSFDSKLFHTLRTLITRPGLLTVEYLAGHRVRYLAPFRIYVTLSALFFLLVGLRSQTSGPTKMRIGSESAGPIQISVGDIKLEPKKQPESTSAPAGETSLLERRLKANRERLKNGGQKALMDKIIGNLPMMMFLLLPFFGGVMKLVYWRSGRLYTEHLVFLLHCHAMGYILLGIVFIPHLGKLMAVAPVLLLIYIFLAARRVYAQSFGKTLLKLFLLLNGYLLIFLICFAAIGLLSLLQT